MARSHDRILLASVVALGVVHAWRYTGHVSDDAYISFRYAHRLASGSGLTWNDGDGVEGYSDLLWVLLVAAGDAVGLDPVLTARALGLLGLTVAIGLVARGGVPRALSGGLILAACGGLAAWAVGGLEHAALAGLVTAFVVGARQGWRGVDLLALPITWMRADGLVLALAAGGIARRPRALLLAGAAAVAQLAFRLLVHGDAVPNTARVKVSLTLGRAFQGLEWVAEALADNGVLVAAGLIGAVWAPRARPAVAIAGVWCAYVALVGGDTFYGYRQLVPVLPLFALAWADGVEDRAPRPWIGPLAAGLYAVSHLGGVAVTTLALPGWAQASREPARMLRAAYAPQEPLLAVDAAGVLPYTTGFPAVDMLGLNDRWLATHPPSDWGGSAGIGHDLGDGAYLASRKPDIVAFCSALGSPTPCFRSGREWVELPDWQLYAPVCLGWPEGVARYFLRTDGPLGVRVGEDALVVPAVLLSSIGAPAVLAGDALVVGLGAGGSVAAWPTGPGWTLATDGLRREGDRLVADRPLELREVRYVRASPP
ncbi:MAG: hypothetical protein KC656_10705 [Myxococcales bacterium]|nr:hypothetical protein [Myxococcales bacterium]